MTEEEMKNKISMELKNPVTQQGFEIICKHILELQKQKGKLTDKVKELEEEIEDWKSCHERELELMKGLNDRIADLEKQIEKMKCCGNCSHRHYWGNELGCNLDLDKQFECDNNNKKYWEFIKE